MKNPAKVFVHYTSGKVVVERAEEARSFWARFKGLIGRSALAENEARYIPECSSIHMWFMRFPIDVVFLERLNDRRFVVRSLFQRIPPWRLLPVGTYGATDVIELPAGSIQAKEIQKGDIWCSN